jgi:hypothetical protein
MRYVAFIDESYSEEAYFLSALVVPVGQLDKMEAEVASLLATFSVFLTPVPLELHAHQLMAGSGRWRPMGNATRQKVQILAKTLGVITRLSGAVIVTEGTDVRRLRARFRYPETPHSITLRHLLEALDTWAVRNHHRISLVADNVASQDVHQREFSTYQASGTGGQASRKLLALTDPITFMDSEASGGLQLVDSVVYLFRREDFLRRRKGDEKALHSVRFLLNIIGQQVVHRNLWLP